jgi:hypothetical protein
MAWSAPASISLAEAAKAGPDSHPLNNTIDPASAATRRTPLNWLQICLIIILPFVKSRYQRTDLIVNVRPSWNRAFQEFPDLRLVLSNHRGHNGAGEASMT